jgi:hypothetical protein
MTRSRWHRRAAELRALGLPGQNGQIGQNSAIGGVLSDLSVLSGRSYRDFDAPPRGTKATTAQPSPAPVISEPPPPGGRWKMLVQLWNIEKARDLVDRLIAAAGPHRMAGLDQQFEKMRTRCSWSGARKIEWLEELCENLAANPYYWPADRPDRTAAGRQRHNKAITVIERNGGQITRQKLLRHVGRGTIESMIATREIVPIGMVWGKSRAGKVRQVLYGLPGAQVHFSTSHKIVRALAVALNHCIELDELTVAVDRSNTEIKAAIKRLSARGIIVMRGNTIALSPAAVAKIATGAIIRDGRGAVLWPRQAEGRRLDQLDLFAAAPQTSTPSPPSDDSGTA